MKTSRLLGLLLIVSLAGAAVTVPRVSRAAMIVSEKSLDDRFKGMWDDVTVTGLTRGVYLEGYGAVFTAEVNLVTVPLSLFHPNATKEEQTLSRAKKVERIPQMKTALKKALTELAASSSLDAVPPDEQVVISVLMLRYQWENGLPMQVIVQAPKKKLIEAQHASPAVLDTVVRVTEY